MDMYFSAKRQTLAQFMEVYDPQRLHEVHGGSTIVFDAMAHQSPQDRYDIVRFLIDQGAELTGTNGENETLFHILFSRPKHNMTQTVELTKLLIDAGADINPARRERPGGAPVSYQPSQADGPGHGPAV